MKAIMRTWDLTTATFEDETIEVDDRYDDTLGPHNEFNEDFCPVVGSNQEIYMDD